MINKLKDLIFKGCNSTHPDKHSETTNHDKLAYKKNQQQNMSNNYQQENPSWYPSRDPNQLLRIPDHPFVMKASTTGFPNSKNVENYFVEIPEKSFSEIVIPRFNTNSHFPKNQVLDLLETLVFSLDFLQENECNHHDFYPSNIFYNQGRFKIAHPRAIQYTSYQLVKQRNRFSFLSPELVFEVLNDTNQNQIHEETKSKSDIFSIGMIMLEFCSLEPSAQCYDAETYHLIDSTIRDRVGKISRLYSPKIASCIDSMLEYDINDRIEIGQLTDLVKKHAVLERQKDLNGSQIKVSQLNNTQQGIRVNSPIIPHPSTFNVRPGMPPLPTGRFPSENQPPLVMKAPQPEQYTYKISEPISYHQDAPPPMTTFVTSTLPRQNNYEPGKENTYSSKQYTKIPESYGRPVQPQNPILTYKPTSPPDPLQKDIKPTYGGSGYSFGVPMDRKNDDFELQKTQQKKQSIDERVERILRQSRSLK